LCADLTLNIFFNLYEEPTPAGPRWRAVHAEYESSSFLLSYVSEDTADQQTDSSEPVMPNQTDNAALSAHNSDRAEEEQDREAGTSSSTEQR
jgi:hypothetical protein